MPLPVLRFPLKNIIMRRSVKGLQSWLYYSPALLQDMSQFVRQQLLPGDGVRLVAPMSEINVATGGESMRVNAAGGIGCLSITMDPDLVKVLAEAVLHHGACLRTERRPSAAAVQRAVKSRRGRGGISFSFALHWFLAAFLAGATAAGASPARHVGAAQNCRCGRVPGQRPAGGTLDSHIAGGAQEIWNGGKTHEGARLPRRDSGRARPLVAVFP